MTTRTTRRAVCRRRAPGVRKTGQRQSNNKWRDALTWLLICEHLIAVICLAMFTSRQVKCGILVSCSRVEHSVGLTTAVKKVPGVNASVDWAKLLGCFAALSSASTLNVHPLSRIRCQTWNCIPAADLIFGGAALHPRPCVFLEQRARPPCCHLYRNRLNVLTRKYRVAHFYVLLYNRWLCNTFSVSNQQPSSRGPKSL